jgi:hypothetical protein
VAAGVTFFKERPPAAMPRKFLNLPKDFHPVDATPEEVASYRRESLRTVHQKIADGRYQSYRESRIRKIIFESVLADRERAIAADRAPEATGKRRVGRPRLKPQPSQAVERS